MKIKKINKESLIKYMFYFFISIIFSNASIQNLNPFLYVLFFAGLYVGLNEKFISITTIISAVLVLPRLENFFIALTVVAVGLTIFYFHKIFKRKLSLWLTFVSYVFSLATFIYYNLSDIKFVFVYLILGIISLFVCVVVVQIVAIRNNCLKLSLDENICFLYFLTIIGLGLSGVEVFGFSIFRLAVMFVILICVSVGSPSLTYIITLALTFGCALKDLSLLPVAEFVIVAMLANVFSMPYKFKICLISILGDFVVQYFFFSQTIMSVYNTIPLLLACLIFMIIPKKQILSLSDLIYVKKSELSSRNAINTTRKNIKKRMAELSNVFLDMQHIHLNMVKKELTKEEIISMLTREIMSSCCKDCLDKNRCTRSLGTDNKSNLTTLVEIAVTKGKLTLLDIPPALSNRCAKINNLICLVNRFVNEYKQYKNVMADVNNVKILLADQMGAVSGLLLNIGNEIDANVKFDIAKENKIISRLLNANIQCREVLLYTEKNEDISAELIVKCNNSDFSKIEKIVSENLKTSMQISKALPIDNGDYISVSLVKKSRFDCVFGLSSCNKAGEIECGDCHSIIRLNKNKFLIALCDGMGSGKNAHQMSAITLGLIENFYKVGFENEIILESVNKLLAVNNQENYSTLDVCVIDLEKQIADFIKVGSPFGLIKRDANIELVEGGSLPIGALDRITPAIHKTTISVKDIIILVTDGITDAFESEDNLAAFVGKLATNNPQTIADSVLNEALRLNGMSAKDDMTVLVARTYLKN